MVNVGHRESEIAQHLYDAGCRATRQPRGSLVYVEITNNDMHLEPARGALRTGDMSRSIQRFVQSCYGSVRDLDADGVAMALVLLCEDKKQLRPGALSREQAPTGMGRTRFRPVRS